MVQKQDRMQRIKKGIGTGDRWDMVRVENGIIGYISQNYVEELPDVEIEKIEVSLENNNNDSDDSNINKNNIIYKGETKTLDVKIYPEEAKEQKIEYISENPEIITVDDKGNVRGIRSGKTVIKVKAKENNVEASIEIECYSKVTNIVVDSKEEIYMQVGDNFKINAYVEPEDANEKGIIFEASNIEDNEDTITIDNQGNIEAKKEGKAIVVVKSKENEEIRKEINVIVVRKMEDWEIHFDSSLRVEGLEISGIDYKENNDNSDNDTSTNNNKNSLKNKVSEIKELITTDLELEFQNYKGETLNDEDLLGTGSRILVRERRKKESEEEKGNILRVYTILIYGDCNGDGKINSVDLLVLQRHILEFEKLEGIFLKASNVRKVGTRPTSVDLLLIQRHILGYQKIEQ